MDYLLPIGSVVRLVGGEKRLMIFGVKQTDATDGGTERDYIAVLYPEGNLGPEHQYMFNHGDIEEIYFYGFSDVERQDFIKLLSETYARPDGEETGEG